MPDGDSKEIKVAPGPQLAGPSDAELVTAGVAGIRGFISGAYDAVRSAAKSGWNWLGSTYDSAKNYLNSSSAPKAEPKQAVTAAAKPKPMTAGPSDQQMLAAGMAGVSSIAGAAYHAVKDLVTPEKTTTLTDNYELNPRIRYVALTNLHLEMEVDGKLRRFDLPESVAQSLRDGTMTPNQLANAVLAKIDAAQMRSGVNFELAQGVNETVGMGMRR